MRGLGLVALLLEPGELMLAVGPPPRLGARLWAREAILRVRLVRRWREIGIGISRGRVLLDRVHRQCLFDHEKLAPKPRCSPGR